METVFKKIRSIKADLSVITIGLAVSIEEAIKHCFRSVFDSKEAILAAITLPKFKLRWVETQSKKDRYKQMLIDEMRLFVEENQLVVENEDDAVQCQAEQGGARKDHFYDFPSDDESSTPTDTVEVEAANYLSTAKELDYLHRYPIIKLLFLKYNTTLPSSAPVERLFSLGNMVLTPKHNRLVDARFEKLLLMRYNKHFLQL